MQLGELSDPCAIRLAEWLAWRCYHHARAVVVVTKGIRRRLLARGLPEARLALIPNGTNADRFQPQPDARRRLAPPLEAGWGFRGPLCRRPRHCPRVGASPGDGADAAGHARYPLPVRRRRAGQGRPDAAGTGHGAGQCHLSPPGYREHVPAFSRWRSLPWCRCADCRCSRAHSR